VGINAVAEEARTDKTLIYRYFGGLPELLERVALFFWVLADLKVHHFEATTAFDHASYTNVTVDGEVGWRFFVWKGFNVAIVGRYGPNVYSTAGTVAATDATKQEGQRMRSTYA